ncbi:hypothetical protein [Streptomyces sp. NPDC057496]|uniref:hypothetical protein n=1 Tax=Streptomyces sp. NPDC057496 TaxID=3346149 RepID=UPI00369AA3BF
MRENRPTAHDRHTSITPPTSRNTSPVITHQLVGQDDLTADQYRDVVGGFGSVGGHVQDGGVVLEIEVATVLDLQGGLADAGVGGADAEDAVEEGVVEPYVFGQGPRPVGSCGRGRADSQECA